MESVITDYSSNLTAATQRKALGSSLTCSILGCLVSVFGSSWEEILHVDCCACTTDSPQFLQNLAPSSNFVPQYGQNCIFIFPFLQCVLLVKALLCFYSHCITNISDVAIQILTYTEQD